MSDMISDIQRDVDEYERLCKKYKEEAVYKRGPYGGVYADCYGEHARSLKDKEKSEVNNSTDMFNSMVKILTDMYGPNWTSEIVRLAKERYDNDGSIKQLKMWIKK